MTQIMKKINVIYCVIEITLCIDECVDMDWDIYVYIYIWMCTCLSQILSQPFASMCNVNRTGPTTSCMGANTNIYISQFLIPNWWILL